jgi:hypothetical protein
LDDLEDYGYIARLPEKPSNTGRPPLPKYLVNPMVHYRESAGDGEEGYQPLSAINKKQLDRS